MKIFDEAAHAREVRRVQEAGGIVCDDPFEDPLTPEQKLEQVIDELIDRIAKLTGECDHYRKALETIANESRRALDLAK